eukprot:767960-Hanusia_phi.AAC.2
MAFPEPKEPQGVGATNPFPHPPACACLPACLASCLLPRSPRSSASTLLLSSRSSVRLRPALLNFLRRDFVPAALIDRPLASRSPIRIAT